nr:diguanylate cyclase [Larsenimonas suaedae]
MRPSRADNRTSPSNENTSVVYDPPASSTAAQLRYLIDAVTEFIVLKDGEGRWLVANRAVIDTYELEGLDYIGMTDMELAAFRPHLIDAFRYNLKTDEQAWAHGKALTIYKSFELDGRLNTWEVVKTPSFTTQGARHQLVIVSRNITDRVEAEQELALKEQKYRLIAENMSDIVGTRRLDGTITYLSPSFEHQLGLALSEYIDRQIGSIIHPEDVRRLQRDLILPPENRELPTTRCRLRLASGTYRWFEISRSMTWFDDIEEYQIVFTCRDIQERVQYEQRLHRLAYEDALTGIPNRRQLLDDLGRRVQQESAFALLYLDIDHFKNINDRHGHDIGDALLTALANRLTEHLNIGDTVARIGGDEFVVVIADADHALAHAERLCHALQAPWHLENQIFHTTSSIGVALCPADSRRVHTLLNLADQALFNAKRQGRGCVCAYSDSRRT